MKKILILALFGLFCFSHSAWAKERQITTNNRDQRYPAVSGNNIVWQDNRHFNWDIYHYDLSTSTETRITIDGTSQKNPAISGNNIVWEDNRDGIGGIYHYDLFTDIEKPIASSEANNSSPAISGRNVVWEKYSDSKANIYFYNLLLNLGQQITNDGYIQSHPAISGYNIVWQDNRSGNDDIYLYNLSSNIEKPITDDAAEQRHPAISGTDIVWQDNRNGNWDIYYYDLPAGIKKPITDDAAEQRHPAISGNNIVWEDNRNGNWDIYHYDLSTGVETQITSNEANQMYPAISGNNIVWEDERNGNSDIYLYDLDKEPPVLTEVVPITTPTNDTTPNYTFNTDEAGTITYGGGCTSTTANATAGDNTITFNELTEGTYDNCTITVTDAADNISSPLYIAPFTIDTTPPTIVLNGDDPMFVNRGEAYTDPGATCTDNSDPICNIIVGGDKVDTGIISTYIVTYDAQDMAGNHAEQKTRTVEVINQLSPIYRFWSDKQQAHFYTMSKSEKEHIEKTYPKNVWRYEGVAYQAFSNKIGTTMPVYRFWSDKQQAHFYTMSRSEKEHIEKTYPQNVWRYEGIAWYSEKEKNSYNKPLFRFWSDKQQAHFYTLSKSEKDHIIKTYPQNVWRYEGIAWYGRK